MRINERLARVSLSVAAGLVVLTSACSSKAVDIQVDAATKFQTLSGWESILSGFEVNESTDSYSPAWVQQAPKIMPHLVNDMGVNRVRVELLSGFENPTDYFADFKAGRIGYEAMKSHFYDKINDNSDPNAANAAGFHFSQADFRIENELLPIKQAVEANGEKLYVNVCYVDFNDGTQGPLRHGKTPDEFAELVTVFFDHLKTKYGITPDALEIILEPENTDDWKGADIGRGAVAAAARLKAAGYNPDFIAPSTVSAGNAVGHFNDATAVSGAGNLFKMLSYHRYSGGDYAAIYNAAKAKGAQTGMLEFFTASVDDLLEDLTVANVSAWEKYAIAAPKPDSDYAYLYANVSNPSNPVVSLGAKAVHMMPYFRFARMGAVRVGATSNSGGVRPVAFINTNGTNVVVVKGDGAALTVRGIRDAVYGVRNVAPDGKITNAADVTATGGVLNVTVPSGVTALYDKNAITGGGGSPGTGGATGSGGATAAGGASNPSGGSPGGGTTGAGGNRPSSGGSATSSGGRNASSGGGGAISGSGGGPSSSGAATGADGGPELVAKASDDSGCGCRVRGSTGSSSSVWLAVVGGSMVAARLARGRQRRAR